MSCSWSLFILALWGLERLASASPPHVPANHERNAHMKSKATELQALYMGRLAAQTASPRKVVYACKTSGCGGLGDRLKGFVFTFILAILLDAEFLAYWEHPVPLRTYFSLGQGVLLPEVEYQALAAGAASFDFFQAHNRAGEMRKLRATDFNVLFNNASVMVVQCNGAVWNHLILSTQHWQAAERYNLHTLSKRQIFEVVMRIHFSSPAGALSTLVADTLSTMADTRIGVQMRLGNARLGSAEVARYTSVSFDAVLNCFIMETLRACNGNCSVFVTTENEEGQERFLAAMKLHNVPAATVPGGIFHTDYAAGNHSEHLKTFADWLVLTQMSSMISSRSGFSETAGWFGCVPSRSLFRPSTCLFSDSVELPLGADVRTQGDEMRG